MDFYYKVKVESISNGSFIKVSNTSYNIEVDLSFATVGDTAAIELNSSKENFKYTSFGSE